MTDALGNPKLVDVIKDRMAKSALQAIPFQEYMDLCLYHEPLGYYRNDRFKIGREGDFYTSSAIGSVMGEMIASYIGKECSANYSAMEPILIVEWGGGSGRLALHVLDELQKVESALYERVNLIMIESSSYHQELQRDTLQAHWSKIEHATESDWLSGARKDGVFVLANELLDAFPVQRVRLHRGTLQESYVAWSDDAAGFEEQWILLPADHPAYGHLQQALLKEGQIVEVNALAKEWISRIAAAISEGRVIIIDYGDEAEELYAAHRMQGTLMCYRQHQAYDNPFIYAGLQDITAHIDFTACVQAALAAGFSSFTLQTQREFLVEQGILHKLQNHFDPDPFSSAAKTNRAIRQLLVSDQMSELFKVLILTKKR